MTTHAPARTGILAVLPPGLVLCLALGAVASAEGLRLTLLAYGYGLLVSASLVVCVLGIVGYRHVAVFWRVQGLLAALRVWGVVTRTGSGNAAQVLPTAPAGAHGAGGLS